MLDLIHTMVVEHPYWMMLVSFILAALADAVWAKWSKALHSNNAIFAANWSVLIYLCSILYTLVVIEKDLKQISAYILGAWAGTFLTVIFSKNEKAA